MRFRFGRVLTVLVFSVSFVAALLLFFRRIRQQGIYKLLFLFIYFLLCGKLAHDRF
jgi:hypothetical protein